MRVSKNHEHEPSDEVYIGLFAARGAVRSAPAEVIKVRVAIAASGKLDSLCRWLLATLPQPRFTT